MAGIKIVGADDWCVLYRKYCLDVSDPQLQYCKDCGCTCATCPQRMPAVRF